MMNNRLEWKLWIFNKCFFGNSKLYQKIDNLIKNKTVRSGALFTFFAFLNNGIGFLLLIILAKFIPPGEYGQLNLFNTFVVLLSVFISLCTSNYAQVVFFRRSLDDFKKVINVILLTTTSVLFVLSILLLFLSGLFEKIIGIEIQYQWVALFICYFQVFNSLNLDIWRMEEKPISYGLYSVSSVFLNFIIALVLVISFRQGWLGRIYAQASVAIVYFFISVIFLIKRKYLSLILPSKKLFKDTIKFSLPIIPHSSSFWLKQGLDRYIINYFHASESVGYYSLAMNLASIINIVGIAFNNTNSVFIYKNLANGYKQVEQSLKKQTKLMVVFFALLTIFIIVAVSMLIPILAPSYTGAIIYILPLCIGGFFQCIYLLYVNFLFFYKKTKQLMYITFLTSLLQVLLSIILTKYSVMWTAYISMFITIITATLVYLYSYYILKNELIKEFGNE